MNQELISIILNVLAPVIITKLIVIKNRSVRPWKGGIKPAHVVLVPPFAFFHARLLRGYASNKGLWVETYVLFSPK